MLQIIKNEWLSLARNRVLLSVSVAFALVLMVAVYLGNLQTEKQQQNYTQAHETMREHWEELDDINPHRAAHYGTYVFKPSNLLGSLDEGVNAITGNVLRVEGHVQNEIVYSEVSQSQTASRFGKLKSSLLLQFVVPLFLIFLAFHSVYRERQQGRLRMLLLQGTDVSSIGLAKVVSIWLYGVFLLGFTVSVYTLTSDVSLTGEALTRTSLFATAYSSYYLVVVALTVFLSFRLRNTNVALTSMLGIWILWTVFLPNILMSTVEQWHELPSREVFSSSMQEDRSKGLDGHNPRDERREALKAKVLKENNVDSLHQLPFNFDGLVMQADEEYGNKVWDKHFGELREILASQKQSYQLGGIVAPFVSLQNLSMGLAGNDNFHHQDFLMQVENYRRGFIKTLNDEHAYGGSKTGDWRWTANTDFYKSVEEFSYTPTPLSGVLNNYLFDMIALLSWSVLVLGLLFLGLKRTPLQ